MYLLQWLTMAGGGNMVEQQLIAATQIIEQQLDAEIERMDNLDTDDLEIIRRERLAAMKKRQEKKQDWITNVNKYLSFIIASHNTELALIYSVLLLLNK